MNEYARHRQQRQRSHPIVSDSAVPDAARHMRDLCDRRQKLCHGGNGVCQNERAGLMQRAEIQQLGFAMGAQTGVGLGDMAPHG